MCSQVSQALGQYLRHMLRRCKGCFSHLKGQCTTTSSRFTAWHWMKKKLWERTYSTRVLVLTNTDCEVVYTAARWLYNDCRGFHHLKGLAVEHYTVYLWTVHILFVVLYRNVFSALHLFSACLRKCDNLYFKNFPLFVLYFWPEMRLQKPLKGTTPTADLSFLGYYRNMVEQHSSVSEGGPTSMLVWLVYD